MQISVEIIYITIHSDRNQELVPNCQFIHELSWRILNLKLLHFSRKDDNIATSSNNGNSSNTLKHFTQHGLKSHELSSTSVTKGQSLHILIIITLVRRRPVKNFGNILQTCHIGKLIRLISEITDDRIGINN